MITRFLSASAILLIVICEIALASDAIEITTDPSIHHLRQPQAAVDSSGNRHITFSAGESVCCSTSTDRACLATKALTTSRYDQRDQIRVEAVSKSQPHLHDEAGNA